MCYGKKRNPGPPARADREATAAGRGPKPKARGESAATAIGVSTSDFGPGHSCAPGHFYRGSFLHGSLLVMSDIVSQYMLLKDRGQQIFDGLRDLPQFGKRLWEPYFRRAFDIYNKLWKFQQEHRSTLEAEYGLQRHEVRAQHMT